MPVDESGIFTSDFGFLAGKSTNDVILIAPAHLLSQWDTVMKQFGVTYHAYSYQMASLGKIPAQNRETLWIADEAHYLKNTATQRYRELNRLMAKQKVCLLTATPVSMGIRDLESMAKLCGYCWQAEESWICSYMQALMPQNYVPALQLEQSVGIHRKKIYYTLANQQTQLETLCDCLAQISCPVFTDDGMCIDVTILRELLLNRLMSHRTSCLTTIKRLERYYANCRDKKGRCISRQEFFRMMGDEGRQMLLPFENTYGQKISCDDNQKMTRTLNLLTNARLILEDICMQEDHKLSAVSRIITQSDEQIILFSQYADTVCYFAQKLKQTQLTAAITSNMSTFLGYDINRSTILDMFDPNTEMPVNWTEAGMKRAKILVCSDAMACGHNFQRATRLIHLDQPWNPVTIQQREGRILRKGQNANEVEIYGMYLHCAPPILESREIEKDSCIQKRQMLQHKWHQDLTLKLCISEAVILHEHGIPGLWGKLGTEWIPISYHSIRIKKINTITQTTAMKVFESSLIRYKKLLTPIWKKIKRHHHQNDFEEQFEKFSSTVLTLILKPWLFHDFLTNTHTNEIAINHSSSQSFCEFQNIPKDKMIKTSLTCDWIQFTGYPQAILG